MGTDVTIVEYLPNIVPVEDKDISKELNKTFKKSGIKVMTSSEVLSVDTSGKGVTAKVKTSKGEENISADIILSAVGIKTNIENIGLEEVGIAVDRDKILVDKYYGTNIPGYYAIGDVTAKWQFTHSAEYCVLRKLLDIRWIRSTMETFLGVRIVHQKYQVLD